MLCDIENSEAQGLKNQRGVEREVWSPGGEEGGVQGPHLCLASGVGMQVRALHARKRHARVLQWGFGLCINDDSALHRVCSHLCTHAQNLKSRCGLQLTFGLCCNALSFQRTCYYTQNPNSMMHTIYNSAFFVAIKKPSRGFHPGQFTRVACLVSTCCLLA